MKSKKKPAFMFYIGDWQKDAELRRCSLAEKGAWIELLLLMHETENRGRLTTNNVPWTLEEIANSIGCNGDVTLVKSLINKGVMKQDENGACYCKRMVKDEFERKKSRERVSKFRDKKSSCNAKEIKRNTVSSDIYSYSTSVTDNTNVLSFNNADVGVTASAQSNDVKVKVKKSRIQLTDETFIKSLEDIHGKERVDQALKGAKTWLLSPKGRGRQLTRQFLSNWLARSDVPLSSYSNDKQIDSRDILESKKANWSGGWEDIPLKKLDFTKKGENHAITN